MSKILIVEDTSEIAEMMRFVLTVKSHEIGIANSKKIALQMILSFAPDLLIIDVWLAPGNGRDFCKEIREFDKKIPIILMSANKELLDDYDLCEANEIIEKPFELKELYEKVDRLLKA
jgi:DNA-binding response OmpR family regulator